MKCLICNGTKFLEIHSYNKPDKYEKWVGISRLNRCWVRCMKCGFFIQVRDYDLAELEKIYRSGYRDEKFRGESIEHAFERITAIKNSENESRFIWFAANTKYEESVRVLDVGSGIGVWPHILQRAGYDVTCVEENGISMDFLYDKLGLTCFLGVDAVYGEYDAVTLVHILEHIEDPEPFLAKVKEVLRKGGHLFVEVPDSIEFSYLDKDHDEFNSCHTAFYNMSSLYRTMQTSGFTVVDMHLEKTKARNLSRVMCLAVN